MLALGKSSVLVIGASRGIGWAVAERFVRDGHQVAATHRDGGTPPGTLPLEADVTDTAAVENALAAAAETHGPVDTLVVCSGIHDDKLLLRMTDESISTVFEVNTFGPMRAVRAALKGMLRAKRGSIVLVSSVAGRAGHAGQTNYAASKAALDGFSRSFAREYATRGIRINVVAPGPTDTDMVRDLTDEQRRFMRSQIPMDREGRPDEIADVVYWVSRSTFMTGATVPVGGGSGMGQ